MFMRVIEKILIIMVRVYQVCLSPFLSPCCRFYPTCSEYTITAIKKYGPLKGVFSGLKRLLRCHPLHPGGYDPVK